jgi:hypothetical protein
MLKNAFFLLALFFSLGLNKTTAQSGGSCDSVIVSLITQDLIADGFTCLNGAGPFACIEDVLNYAFENCPPIDTTSCDTIVVNQLIQHLIINGSECLATAGPFACVDDVLEYAFENCPPIDTTGGNPCDTAVVNQLIQDLIADGFECLATAGPLACVTDVLDYAFENCPLPPDTTLWVEPACLQNLPTTVVTFQQFLQYITANCDSTFTAEIPACWLTAPTFPTDEAFFEWVFQNCPNGGTVIIGGGNRVIDAYLSRNTALSDKEAGNLMGITLSPNPTTSDVEIRLAEGQISRVELTDLTGRQVLTQQYEGLNGVQISMNKVPAGVYIARIADTQGRVATQKVVKQ